MNINIHLDGITYGSDLYNMLQYLQNIYQQCNNIGGLVDNSTYLNSVNNTLSSMVNTWLSTPSETDCYNIYNNNIDAIESNKNTWFEAWEVSIRDQYIAPQKILPP